jgi:hypothetical protein
VVERVVSRIPGGPVSTPRPGAVLAVVATLGAALGGCIRPETCGARGDSTSLSGVVSYAVGTGAGSTLSQTITIDDYAEGCTYDDEEFPIFVGSCELWVSLDQGPEPPARYFPGNPSAWAMIESGQVCELALSGGTAEVTVDSGTLAFSDATTGVFLSGTVTKWTTGEGPKGPIQWQFQASGWPH